LDTKLRSKYRSLKIRIILQTLGISLIVACIGYFVLDIFVDGVFQDPFAKTVVYIFERIGMDELEAIRVYRLIFVQNKTMIIGAGFFVLLLLSFYLGMSKFTTYLRQVEGGIQMILNESKDRILLLPELNPLENKLNEIKGTLKEQRRIAEESEQRKNDIIVYLAHDLKTPLTSIIAYLSLLNESPDMSEEQRAKYTGISLEKAKRLGELINEFFEITRYNLQNITLDKKEFYLYVLLEQVMDSFAAVFKQKGLEWKIEVDDKILIYGDPDRFARVFENLLRNAVSYCYPNSLIEVYGMIDGDNAEILVRNQGKTIPEHQLNNLFEKFYRLDEARSSETGGAGLGLAIAKEIIELHDGTIKAKSQNEYTTFIIRLPRKKEEQ
jgi:two-component system sensor histidine kinase VanS